MRLINPRKQLNEKVDLGQALAVSKVWITYYCGKIRFLTLLFISFACFGSEYSGTWGLPVGAESPEIQALDQGGRARDFESLSGRQGLLFVLSRSADW